MYHLSHSSMAGAARPTASTSIDSSERCNSTTFHGSHIREPMPPDRKGEIMSGDAHVQ
jgi:hypothetical protein